MTNSTSTEDTLMYAGITEILYIEGVQERQSDAGFWGLNQTPNQPVLSLYSGEFSTVVRLRPSTEVALLR